MDYSIISHERLPSHLYILCCGTHSRHAKHVSHAGNTSGTHRHRRDAHLRIESRNNHSDTDATTVSAHAGLQLAILDSKRLLPRQQELAVSRLSLLAVYCLRGACTSCYYGDILVLTDYIRSLLGIILRYSHTDVQCLSIPVLLQNVLRLAYMAFLLCRARHSSTVQCPGPPAAQYCPFHCAVLS